MAGAGTGLAATGSIANAVCPHRPNTEKPVRVVRRFFVCVAVGVSLTGAVGASPASAGGSWMFGEWDRYEAGETVTMVGFFGDGQQGTFDDGPFFAHVRPVVNAPSAVAPPSVLTAPVRFSGTAPLRLSFGSVAQVRVETTFALPADFPPGEYMVSVCNTGCQKGIGDLIGGPLWVGVDATWPITRNWPDDDPAAARARSQPDDRRSKIVSTDGGSVTYSYTEPATTVATPVTTARPTVVAAGSTSDQRIVPTTAAGIPVEPQAARRDRSAIAGAAVAALLATGAVFEVKRRRSRRVARRAARDARVASCVGGVRPARPATVTRRSCRHVARTQSDRAARRA